MREDEDNPFAPPETDTSATQTPIRQERFTLNATTNAAIEAVPSPHGGAARSYWREGLRGSLTFVYAMVFFVIFLGIEWLLMTLEFLAGFPFLLATFGTLCLLTFVWNYARLGREEVCWKAQMLGQLRSRPDSLIRDGQSPCRFVMLTTPPPDSQPMIKAILSQPKVTDIGFLYCDPNGGETLLEGDKFRYRFPSGCLLACEVQEAAIQTDEESLVRLVYQSQEGIHELHLLPEHGRTSWIFGDTKQKERAAQLANEILAVNENLPE